MNSKQRRSVKRKWLSENAEEIERLINWINGPNKFVASEASSGDCIDMRLEQMAAFGSKWKSPKSYWKDYLLKRGVKSSQFIIQPVQSEKNKLITEPVQNSEKRSKTFFLLRFLG